MMKCFFMVHGVFCRIPFREVPTPKTPPRRSQATATVLRGGKEIEIKSNHIVRGDIVILGTGDVCPADVRLITADELKVPRPGEGRDGSRLTVLPAD